MRRRWMLAAAAALACSPGERAPTAEEVSAKIRALPEFRNAKTVTVTLMAPFSEPVTILNRMGFLNSRSTTGGDFFYLSQSGKEAAREWTLRKDPDHPERESYIVPLARRELVEVSAIRRERDVARADFAWRYKPNRVGRAMALDEQLRPATVYFRLRKNTWRVDESNLPMF